MRIAFALLVAISLLWGGYWFYGANRVEAEATNWFINANAAGMQADHGGLNVLGFPNRFDLTVTEPDIADPQTGVRWTAPFFQIFALSYRPHHVIATWPNEQQLVLGDVPIAVTSDRMQASAVFSPTAGFTLNRSSAVAEGLLLRQPEGELAVTEVRIATRTHEGSDDLHDIALNATGLRPMPLPEGVPPVIDLISAEGTLQLTPQMQPQSLALRNLRVTWGGMQLRGQGTLEIDATGALEGRIDLSATNWREMLRIAIAAGVVRPELASTYEAGLALLAGVSGPAEELEVPLSFQQGRMSLGPLPLGAAPRITPF